MDVRPGCPFCRKTLIMKDRILHRTDAAYVIEPNTQPGSLLIIPEIHYESLQDLPDSWWAELKQLLRSATKSKPGFKDYNLSINIGDNAGQKLKHLHFWLIPREAGLASSGKGLAALMNALDSADKGVEQDHHQKQ